VTLKPGKYLKSEANGHVFVYDEQTAALPQMRVVHISGEADTTKPTDTLTVDVRPQQDLRREDYEALFIDKFKRKPHPKMGLEKLRAAVEGTNGNDSSDGDS